MLDKLLSPIPTLLIQVLTLSFIIFCAASKKEMHINKRNTSYSTGGVWLTCYTFGCWYLLYFFDILDGHSIISSSSFYKICLLQKISLSKIKELTSKGYRNKLNGSQFLHFGVLTKDLLKPTHLASLILGIRLTMSHKVHNMFSQ